MFDFSLQKIMNLYGGNLISLSSIYVCSVYIPPANSRYYGKSEKDPYDELQTVLLNYSKLGKIILIGDFNARKGNLLDSSVDSNNDFHLTDISEIADINVGAQAFVKMHSLDQTVNKYGRCLVNFCNSNNLSILNGRTRGDMLGKFTCYKSNGSSVIDYAIVSSDLMKQVTYFFVLPLSVYSCHCPI